MGHWKDSKGKNREENTKRQMTKTKYSIAESSGCTKVVLEEVTANIGLPQGTRKIPNTKPSFTAKGIREIRTKPNLVDWKTNKDQSRNKWNGD